jgi:hypothetical protein
VSATNCDFGNVTRHRVLDRKGRITGYVVVDDDGKWTLEGDPFVADLLRALTKWRLDLSNERRKS